MMDKKCPCNPTIFYSECCQKAHQDIRNVKTAEQLMRSRYTAFVLANGPYLQQSHHSSTRPNSKENRETIAWAKSVQWLRLDVLATTGGKEKNHQGTVEFKAYFYENGEIHYIHENSLFIKEDHIFKYQGRLR